jgi:hypothetical protein
MGAVRYLLGALALIVATCSATVAFACSSPASYRSVILNTVPEQVPPDARVYHVRIDEALYDAERQEIMGVRGVALDATNGVSAGSRIEITGRLGSMCNTWYEVWSRDHDIEDGILSGYVIGRVSGAIGETVMIEPLLFQAKAHLEPERASGKWLGEAWRLPRDERRMMPSSAARWMSLRLDAKTLAENLSETNRLIREDIDRPAND